MTLRYVHAGGYNADNEDSADADDEADDETGADGEDEAETGGEKGYMCMVRAWR